MSDGIEIAFDAPSQVRAAIDRLGRSEDVRFSPDNQRLALPSFDRRSISIFELDLTIRNGRPEVLFTGAMELTAPGLDYPHGVDFLDDDTLIVANRAAGVAMFRLPSYGEAGGRAALTPLEPPAERGFDLLDGPSALAVASRPDGDREVLIGHRYARRLTRHVLHERGSGSVGVTTNEVLLERSITIVDGVAVSPDGAWLAVSNPWHQSVLVYDRSSSLGGDAEPRCVLRGASYPHGVCFARDGALVFVADAGSPYIHIHEREGPRWEGVQHPAFSLRVMDDETFARGRHNAREGGPKGIDVDRSDRVLAVTSEHQPLACFDVAMLLEDGLASRPDRRHEVAYELGVAEAADALFDERLSALEATRSFRIARRLQHLGTVGRRTRRWVTRHRSP